MIKLHIRLSYTLSFILLFVSSALADDCPPCYHLTQAHYGDEKIGDKWVHGYHLHCEEEEKKPETYQEFLNKRCKEPGFICAPTSCISGQYYIIGEYSFSCISSHWFKPIFIGDNK